MNTTTQAECDNCGHVCDVAQLGTIKHYHERVEEGAPIPAGECPECGCLAYEND